MTPLMARQPGWAGVTRGHKDQPVQKKQEAPEELSIYLAGSQTRPPTMEQNQDT